MDDLIFAIGAFFANPNIPIDFKEWLELVGLVFWVGILLIPLKGIDCRDVLSCLTYILYCAFAGAVTIIAIPSMKDVGFGLTPQVAFFVLVLMSAAALRWRRNCRVVWEEHFEKEEKN